MRLYLDKSTEKIIKNGSMKIYKMYGLNFIPPPPTLPTSRLTSTTWGVKLAKLE